MKSVFNNAMVAHVWAQQSQPYGRSNNGNLFFEHETIYSYGRHFPIARFVDLPKGGRAILFNSRGYSVSTSGHKSRVRSAIHGLGLPIYVVPGAQLDHAANLRHFEQMAVAAFRKADNPRTRQPDLALADASKALELARQYAKAFGVKWTWKGADATSKRWARQAKAAERERQRLAEQVAAEAAERAARQRETEREAFEEWQRGERTYCPSAYRLDPNGSVYLRVNGDVLETSLGAEVPLEHAIRAFRLIERCRARGEGWTSNGHSIRVGHFTVDQITPGGNMRAGCHYFTWERMAEAARAAGVLDTSTPQHLEANPHA